MGTDAMAPARVLKAKIASISGGYRKVDLKEEHED